MVLMERNGIVKEWKDEDVEVLEPRGWKVVGVADQPQTEPLPEDDIELLRLEADELGIEYDGRIGAKKLKTLIAEKKKELEAE